MLEKARTIAANNWKTLAAIGTAELFERLPDMKDQALSVLSAIASEKSELLSGNPTQRVEHVMAPAADEWQTFVAGLKRREDAVDVAFEPVSGPADTGQKAAELPAPGPKPANGPGGRVYRKTKAHSPTRAQATLIRPQLSHLPGQQPSTTV
jgi:hypothetical protein